MHSDSQALVQKAQAAAKLSLIMTTVNVGIKLTAALITGSISILAEGLQSGVDILIAFGVLQTIKIAERPADDSHPYGHGKAEVLMSVAQMLLILFSAVVVLFHAIGRLQRPEDIRADIGMVAMLISVCINYFTSWKLNQVAKETKSSLIASEVLHLRSDLYAALGILVGLAIVHFTGWKLFDPLIALVFMLYISVIAVRQLGSLIHPLMDGAMPEEDNEAILHYLDAHPQVLDYHDIRGRTLGRHRHVELHVLFDDDLSFVDAHRWAEEIEAGIAHLLGSAAVTIHYEPYREEMEHRAREHAAQEQKRLNT